MASAFFVLSLSIAWGILSAPTMSEIAAGGASDGIVDVHFPAAPDTAARPVRALGKLDDDGATGQPAHRERVPRASRSWGTALWDR